MGAFKDLTGLKFNYWTVLRRSSKRDKRNMILWECECVCGHIGLQCGETIKKGFSKSCGCQKPIILSEKRKTHGKSRTRIYVIWCGMNDRCTNVKNKEYKNYGAKGISVCERWRNSFENFYQDMKNGYGGTLLLERISSKGNYEPANCKWATQKEQQNNRNNNISITHQGTTLTIAQWAEKLNIEYSCLYYRYSKGWTTQEALFGRK